MRDDVWRVDVEVGRDPVTGRRRRVARVIHGTREDAEIALARLKVADHEKRLPSGGTNARSVRAAFQLYLQAVDSGLIELAPATVVTSRSAAKRMCSTALADGRTFGDIRLSRLTWSDIESLYAAMRAGGNGPAWVRRCATVLTRALELARKRGLIDANPSKDAARPRTVRSKPFAPTAAEVRELLAAAAKRDAEATDAAVLLASTGPVRASCSPSAGPTSTWTGLRCISRRRSQTVGAAWESSASRRRDPIGGMSRSPRPPSRRSGGKRRDGAK